MAKRVKLTELRKLVQAARDSVNRRAIATAGIPNPQVVEVHQTAAAHRAAFNAVLMALHGDAMTLKCYIW